MLQALIEFTKTVSSLTIYYLSPYTNLEYGKCLVIRLEEFIKNVSSFKTVLYVVLSLQALG